MTEPAAIGANYQLKSVVDAVWGFFWGVYQTGDVDEGFELFKRNYGVYELEVGGVDFYYSMSPLMSQYRAFRDEIGYQPSDRCPCVFRDGFKPPVPVCP